MDTIASSRRDWLLRLLHLFVLTNLAFAARLYSTLSEERMFFLVRQSGVIDVVLLVLILSLVVPGLLASIELLARRIGPRTLGACHLAMVFVLLTAIFLPICRQVGPSNSRVVVLLALALGAVATLSYGRYRLMRTAVTILWPALLVFPGLFLFTPPISKFLRHDPPLQHPQIGNPVPVVMIVFDELCGTSLMDRQHRIDADRYPNFAALANDSTWFRNATTMSGATHTAIPSLLTGQYPRTTDVEADIQEYPCNLFTLLGARYEMTVAEPGTFLCPASLSPRAEQRPPLLVRLRSLLMDVAVLEAFILLPPDWPLALPDITGRWDNLLGQDQVVDGHCDALMRRCEAFDELLGRIRSTEQPLLCFAHVLLPHTPWVYLPSGKQYDPLPLPPEKRDNMNISLAIVGLKRIEERWADDAWAVTQAWQRHLLQVEFTDRMLGKLLARLKGEGLYDRSLIVVTADHGISFRPGEAWRKIDRANCADTMSVPLLVKLPHQRESRISDRNVQSIDVLPTVADVLDIDLPWKADGRSALDLSATEPAEKLVPPQHAGAEPLKLAGKFDEKQDTLHRMLETFPSLGKPDGLFRVGPNSDLIGRPVQETEWRDHADCRIELFEPEQFANVALQRSQLPCYLGGRIHRSNSQNVDLAVAVNGVIRAVTRTYALAGLEDTWTAMVPEDAFRDGANQVQAFVVRAHRQSEEASTCPSP